ncbi:hypothetical protein C9374_000747 [Naegleria lovaniensis]|uniref:Ergosterol biosynthetic protein 28 n=1 Tax=Naegleria lovaniensis TaxID=51637 RepID=A0AA88KSB9_NAELO|nr:uncharacterized protein C9374_013640 [Naegleria lovaniensis]XP_044551889.1 uncharacterized protein C9374_000747 [Naegleria lovaniensis]KAG2372685.1 hypothetical protein C9374_013640 [Naegleria lovaniensis]KAG2387897.1 hypothetical protein C9374_000747 [Naegleria lovaniensis]
MDASLIHNDKYFSYWLTFVALFRGFSIVTGYIRPQIITKNVYSKKKEPLDPLFGRMFANWTGGSICACLILALYPQSLPMHYMNLCAFAIALGHALLEFGYFKTMSFVNASPMFFFAGSSLAWVMSRIMSGKLM